MNARSKELCGAATANVGALGGITAKRSIFSVARYFSSVACNVRHATEVAGYETTMMKTYYRQQLPHIQPIGAIFFVTTRLAGSLPNTVLTKLMQEHQEETNRIYQNSAPDYKLELYNAGKRYFQRFDKALDAIKSGPHYFRDSEVAAIIKKHLHRFDGERYDLLAYTIMSNHIHFLIDTRVQVERIEKDDWVTEENYEQLPEIMRMIKGASAYEINKHLGQKGTFWQKESYDHFVRSRRK